jgi:serine phosphatase RsbU (regulator of sigma subunit)
MSIFASAKLWVNGSFCFEKGRVASNKEQSIPEFTTEYYSPIKYNNYSDTLEIIVQVTDFSYGGPAAGIRRKVAFGPDNQINTERINTRAINSWLIGIVLVIALYHFFIFLYRTNELSSLIFAMLSTIVVIWTIYASGMFIDSFSYKGYLVFGHIAPIFFPALLVLFYYLIYKDEVHKKVVWTFLIIASILMFIVIVSSTTMMSKIYALIPINLVIPLSYLLAYSLLKALLRKRHGSVLSYLGVFIMTSSVMHDALLASGIIIGFGNYISSYGWVVLIILQALVLAQMFSRTYRRNINLNLNLEAIVKERTLTIDEQRTILEKQNLDLQEQKEEIETQRDHAHKQNKEITDSINYARRIQSAMLPPKRYISELLNESFILYKPRDIVSGDFYWIKQVNKYVVIVAADCSGHGIPGAFMSMLGMGYLNEIVQRREVTQAKDVLSALRKQIKNSLRQHGGRDEAKDGIDMALCVMDLKNRKMQYAGANNPLYLIRGADKEAKVIEYKPDRMPVGYYQVKDNIFNNHDIKLESGDTFYLFSDGFIDQKGGTENKKFMSGRFRKLLEGIQDQTMYDQKITLKNTLSDWMGNNPQVDDILVIGVRVQ